MPSVTTLRDQVRPQLGDLARVDAAEAPADQDDRPPAAEPLDPRGDPLERVRR